MHLLSTIRPEITYIGSLRVRFFPMSARSLPPKATVPCRRKSISFDRGTSDGRERSTRISTIPRSACVALLISKQSELTLDGRLNTCSIENLAFNVGDCQCFSTCNSRSAHPSRH